MTRTIFCFRIVCREVFVTRISWLGSLADAILTNMIDDVMAFFGL
jgi:hypothetical protein